MSINLVKKILFPLFSVFLIYRTFELVKQLMATAPGAYSNSEIPLIAFLFALFVTGIFAFPGFAYPTSLLLPVSYYKIKNPKRLLMMYRLLGVRYFKVFLLVFFWGREKNRHKYFNGTRSGFQNFVYQAKQSEFGHLMAFVFITLISFLVMSLGHLLLFALLTLINIAGNLYPVILQRHHRIRIGKIFETTP